RNDFSDPQGGKGICDRQAATIKGDIGRYVNEGSDVTTAIQLNRQFSLVQDLALRLVTLHSTPKPLCFMYKLWPRS
ncbi:unnamed protein product, partial [Pocillopora meandrina]